MDFNHGWKNSTGDLSPLFGNSFPYVPSPYPESLCNIRSGPNSLVNLPCCYSPGCVTRSTISSEHYTPNIIHQNVRYHLHQPPFEPVRGIDNRRRETQNFYSGNTQAGSIINERRFDAHANYYQSINMSPNLYKGKLDDKTNFKSNPKRKRQRNFKNTNIMPKRSFSTQNIDSQPQINYDPNLLLNSISDKGDFVNIKQKNEYSKSPIINKPNYAYGKKYPREEAMKANIDNVKFPVYNLNDSEKMNLMTHSTKHATVNSGYQNGLVINNFSNEHESGDLMFVDAITRAVMNNFESKNNADLSDCRVTHTTMPKSSSFNVDDIQQENVSGKKYSHEEVMKSNIDNMKFQLYNSNDSEKMNLVTHSTEHATDNSAYQNAQIINFSNEHESTDLIFGDAVTSAVVNNYMSKNNPDLPKCQVTPTTVTENSIFNVQDSQQENLENIDLTNYFFKPIFEGKNENGEDVVILLDDPNTQTADLVNITNTSTGNRTLERGDNQAILTYMTENTTLSSEISSESQLQEVNNEIDESPFFTYMNDYGVEETVISAKKKYTRTKNLSNTSNEKQNENQITTSNQTSTGGNCSTSDFTLQPSASTDHEATSTSENANLDPSNVKCNCKCKHFRSRQQMPRWKRRLLWKCNNPVKNMQRGYFRRFMKKVKNENEGMIVSEDFWNMYRMIVTRIGGSVLQTLYNILPALIRNSGKIFKTSNDCSPKQNS